MGCFNDRRKTRPASLFGQHRALLQCLPAIVLALGAASSAGQAAPAIQLSATNQVPACVTPGRLEQFLDDQLRQRRRQRAAAHRPIAKWYRKYGEEYNVRWDYAFFQMALETNFLSFRRADGRRGDVHPRQNNFAGLGATGGGVAGDRYEDAATGVLAQIQHLVVYSGRRIQRPVGRRTRQAQDIILSSTAKIRRRRPVTFADLAGRWAADRKYGRSIGRLAGVFYADYCKEVERRAPMPKALRFADNGEAESRKGRGRTAPPLPSARQDISGTPGNTTGPFNPAPSQLTATRSKLQLAAPAVAGAPGVGGECRVRSASFGGTRAVLIEEISSQRRDLTALAVQPGFEVAMAENFIAAHAPKGRPVGVFDTHRAAIRAAHTICTSASGARQG